MDLGLRSLAWSPDGRWLAVSHREREELAEGLFLVSARTGEKRRLTQPPRGFLGDFTPAFLTGWTYSCLLSAFRLAPARCILLPLSGDFEPQAKRGGSHTNELWAVNPVWTARRTPHPLRLCARQGGPSELRKIVCLGIGRSEQVPLPEENIHRVEPWSVISSTLEAPTTATSGAPKSLPLESARRPQLLISSTLDDIQPRYSPDGKKIAFGSTRSGTREIWVADADGSNPVQLTSFGGPLVGFMNWSPDSQRLVFHARPEGQADLFTIPVAGGRRSISPRIRPTIYWTQLLTRWSLDLLHAATRSGQFEVWKMPAEGGDATQITRSGGGQMPVESPDGKTLYYAHLRAGEGNLENASPRR